MKELKGNRVAVAAAAVAAASVSLLPFSASDLGEEEEERGGEGNYGRG